MHTLPTDEQYLDELYQEFKDDEWVKAQEQFTRLDDLVEGARQIIKEGFFNRTNWRGCRDRPGGYRAFSLFSWRVHRSASTGRSVDAGTTSASRSPRHRLPRQLRTGRDSRDRRPVIRSRSWSPANVRDHHVPRAQHCGGVTRFKQPWTHLTYSARP